MMMYAAILLSSMLSGYLITSAFKDNETSSLEDGTFAWQMVKLMAGIVLVAVTIALAVIANMPR